MINVIRIPYILKNMIKRLPSFRINNQEAILFDL